jgi:hypothetical protein
MRSRRPAVRVHPTPPIGPTDRPKDSNQRVRLTESQTRRETPYPSSLAYGSMLWPTEPRTTVCGVEQVLQLQYRVRWLSDDVSVRNDAAPVMVQLAGFSCSLSGETLIAEPSSDYSSVDAARAALEPAWHAWEASSEPNQGLRFSFKYTGSACTTWRPASSALSRSTMWSH